MLIKELKDEIKKYNKKELESIIVELYKRLPKSKKEDYNIDEFIKNINNGNSNNKKLKKGLDFETLRKEILYFLQCVDLEYYAYPNRVVPKKERSSWRFKVKRYYKELNNISPNSENGPIATLLLIEIFKRLSIGSNRLLFINWETFKALGVSQDDYYDTLIRRIIYNGYSKDNLQKAIDLLDIPKDPYELSYSMFWTFISNLKTVDTKEIAIQLLDEKIKKFREKLKVEKNDHAKYILEENINNSTMCIIEIYFLLSETEKGINYFNKNYIEKDSEIKEYILLEKLEDSGLLKEWVREYEKQKDKINFRDSLKEKYEKYNR